MTQDELKALWAELGENHYNHRIGDYANDIPPGPPRPGSDECDRFVPRVPPMLETHIRGERQALLGNLRAFPPRGTTNEVWNHGIGKYIADVPRRSPARARAPSGSRSSSTPTPGSSLNGQDDKPRVDHVRVHPRLRARRQGRRDQPRTLPTGSPSAARRCSPR